MTDSVQNLPLLAVISPARNMAPASRAGFGPTRPLFEDKAALLAAQLAQKSPWQLESLLDVPPEKGFYYRDCFENFRPGAAGSPALLAYVGAAFRNMGLDDFCPDDLAFAEEHLRILSAFYGLLRPADGMQPHRLGLKKEFAPGGKTLYQFWGHSVYTALFSPGRPVVNLASGDYTRLFAPYLQPGDSVLSCRFVLQKPDGIRGTVSTVRAARGRMVRFIVKNRITRLQDLREFDDDGYRFSPLHSGRGQYVFVKNPRGL